MPPLNDPLLLTAVTCFALSGAIVLTSLLAVEYFGPRWSLRAALVATIGLLLAAAAMGLWLRLWEYGAPLVLLAGGTALSLIVRTRMAQRAVVLVTRPVAVMASLLVLSLSAAAYVNGVARTPPDENILPIVAGTSFHSVDGLVAVTDMGQALPLIAYDDDELLGEKERQYISSERFQSRIIRLNAPSTLCNCHGWVFTGGRFAIQSRYVDELLADNGYVEVNSPQAEDVIIYRSFNGIVEHTGLVRMVGQDGLILVESKWGPLGVYLHAVDEQPYGVKRNFYRSPRAGHIVSIVPESSAPESRLPALAGLHHASGREIDASHWARRMKSNSATVYERPIVRVPGERKG